MGYYPGQYENPCPRCGNIVYTLFISVGNMSYTEECSGCKTQKFTEEEKLLLGYNKLRSDYLNDSNTISSRNGENASRE